MVLQLHIWGPAFGLPSIDPECIATVAYCQQVIPEGEWALIADFDTTVGATESLPVLIDDGVATATGYEDIVAYLRNHPRIAEDLDVNLTAKQQTDRIAFISFLQSTATPLIDLYLYVSAENYNTATSCAYTAILPWYANYTIPPKRRDLARSRTTHMGLSSLDVDTTAEEAFAPGRGTASSEYEAAKKAAGIPTESQPHPLKMGRGKGIGGLLGTPVYAARFRLDALSNELLEPLSDLLGQRPYLFGNHPCSLDTLAFGYLSLLLFPKVPQAWLKETIQTKFPRVAAYVRRMRKTIFSDEETNPATVWSITAGTESKKGDTLLPWQPKSSDFASRTWIGTREILGNTPLISSLIPRRNIQADSFVSCRHTQSSLPSPLFVNTLVSVAATAAVGLGALAVHHRRWPRDGPLIFWASRPSAGLGEAGNILSVFANQIPSGGAF